MDNYPVKYTVIPVKNEIFVGYIVVKSYVFEIKTKKENDKTSTCFIVGYPVDDKNYNYRVETTDELYNSYKQAQEVKLKKNKELLEEKLNNCHLEQRKEMYIKYRKYFDRLSEIENTLSTFSEDLKITKQKIKIRSK